MHYGAERTWGARIDDGWTYRGLRTVVVENEVLRAVVLADKGADVLSLVHKPTDTEFLWRSPWGVRDPRRYVPTSGDAEAVWIDHYPGGWQTILPNGGHPAVYRGAPLGQHGEASLMPWDHVITEDTADRVEVRLSVRLARSPLEVTKRMSLEAGSPVLVVADEVTNAGAEDVEVVWGQHVAFGPPFLGGDCVIDLPGGTVHTHPERYSDRNRLRPGTATAWPSALTHEGEEVDLRRVPPPEARWDDQAYITDLPDGWYALTNTARRVGVAVRFPHDLYRWLWYWQMLGGGTGYPWWGRTYNIGLEPFTSWPNLGLEEAIRNGSALTIPAGHTVRSELRVAAFTGTGAERVEPDGTVVTRRG